MEFKRSVYYNKDFLGKHLYERIVNSDEIFTVQEFFNMDGKKKKYENYKENEHFYELKVFDNHYELDCEALSYSKYIVFDKPVYIVGSYCYLIIAPEILIKSNKNSGTYHCVTNKLVINSNYNYDYRIRHSKIKNIFCYNEDITPYDSQIDNFYIKNEELKFSIDSQFLEGHKIKCFGKCDDLKKKILKDENFQNGIIHIE